MRKIIKAEIEIHVSNPSKDDKFIVKEIKNNLNGLEIYLDSENNLCENIGIVKVKNIRLKY